MTSVALLAGLLTVSGLLVVVSGVRRQPVTPRRRRGRGIKLPTPERTALMLASGLLTLFFTRWPVAAVGIATAAAVATSVTARRRTASVNVGEKAEALAAWAEMLRDATSTPRGIEGLLVATAPNAPEAIRPQVIEMAERLSYEPLEQALGQLADDLDHPVGDLVVTALRLSARTGGRQIRGVLDDLVTAAREEARMHRRVGVARARPRSEMHTVLVLMAAFVGAFVLLGQGYLKPYGTPLGQVVLAGVAGLWALAVWAMGRLGRSRQVDRFLAQEVSA